MILRSNSKSMFIFRIAKFCDSKYNINNLELLRDFITCGNWR